MSILDDGFDHDDDGRFTMDRVDEAWVQGLQAMREMLARFVEQGGNPEIANSMRLNWNPSWGKDPGKPDEIQDTWD